MLIELDFHCSCNIFMVLDESICLMVVLLTVYECVATCLLQGASNNIHE